jgi:competence protein ComEA
MENEVKKAVQNDLSSYLASCVLIFLLGTGLMAAWLLGERPILARQAQATPPAQSSSPENQSAHPEFPAGEGREVVLRLCSNCHSPNIILANGQTREHWEITITKMVTLGATGTDEDFTDIADYLTANFPPSKIPKLFVNKAKDQQLATLLGISLDDAKAIITYRDLIGGFKSIEDMKKAPNVDAKKIDAKKESLVF